MVALLAAGRSRFQLARQYGVTSSAVRQTAARMKQEDPEQYNEIIKHAQGVIGVKLLEKIEAAADSIGDVDIAKQSPQNRAMIAERLARAFRDTRPLPAPFSVTQTTQNAFLIPATVTEDEWEKLIEHDRKAAAAKQIAGEVTP